MLVEKLISPAQAAAILGMSIQFVREHAADLGGVQMGGRQGRAGRWRFRESKLDDYITNNSGGTPARRRPNEKAPSAKPERMAG
jgi:hypothetical protein